MLYRLMKRFSDYNILHDVIDCLTASLEAKDNYTSGHSNRVGDMAFDICKSLKLSIVERDRIHIAAHLHDIGKIGIPDHILNKPGRLSPAEWAQIQDHPEIGYTILSKSRKLKDIGQIVLSHHERWDGKGYPHGLKGEEIPLGARIIGVCDSIDAMTSDRAYRKAFTWAECKAEIIANKGSQFDPEVVEAITDSLWSKWQMEYCKERERERSLGQGIQSAT